MASETKMPPAENIEVALDDPDNPEWTEADFARARPARDVLSPELYKALTRGRGRPKSETPKVVVNLRLDADVVDRFRAGGAGWQTRINAALRKALDVADARG
jgi:uncharacterized protein (DUF4415 family)